MWDFIIVGAGSAGCVLADRLSADPSKRVLLLEAGPRDRNPLIHVPAGLMKLGGKYDWLYQAEPDPTRGNRVDRWNAGRVLGGSSSINGMVWVRGNPADFDSWAAAGCEGWSYDDVLPYFMRAEQFDGAGDDDLRGRDGPQHVTTSRIDHPLTGLFLEAAAHSGHPITSDYNGREQRGAGQAQLSQRSGLRHSTARAYLGRARRRRNLDVRTGVTVSRVVFSGRRAVGVEYHDGRTTVQATCREEVVVSAGTLGSPKVLLLSGIGPADHLRAMGIDVVAASPGVGANLQEHPYAQLTWEVKGRTLNQETTPLLMAKHGLDFVFRRRGALTSPPAYAFVFAGSDEHGRPTLQCNFRPFGVALGSSKDGDDQAARLNGAATACCIVTLLHPRSRGTIELRSADPDDQVRVVHSLFDDAHDLVGLREAALLARTVMEAPPMASQVEVEQRPGPEVRSDEDWDDFLRANSFMAKHPVGTCAMGAGADAVLDPQLRVRGVDGLRVIDASVMPGLPSGNTNAATVMIAERGADLVLGPSPVGA